MNPQPNPKQTPTTGKPAGGTPPQPQQGQAAPQPVQPQVLPAVVPQVVYSPQGGAPAFRQRGGSFTSLIFLGLIIVGAYLYFADDSLSPRMQTAKKKFLVAVRSAPERISDAFRGKERRVEIMDDLVLSKLRQREIVSQGAELRKTGNSLPILRTQWTKVHREYMGDAVQSAIRRCGLKDDRLKGIYEPTYPTDWEFQLRTILEPVEQAINDQHGDYVPGEEVLAELKRVQIEIDGTADEYRKMRRTMTEIINEVREGRYCEFQEGRNAAPAGRGAQ